MERVNWDMKTDTERGDNSEGCVMTEARIVVRQLQAKKCQGFMVIIRQEQEQGRIDSTPSCRGIMDPLIP